MKTQLITLSLVLAAVVCACQQPTPRQKAVAQMEKWKGLKITAPNCAIPGESVKILITFAHYPANTLYL